MNQKLICGLCFQILVFIFTACSPSRYRGQVLSNLGPNKDQNITFVLPPHSKTTSAYNFQYICIQGLDQSSSRYCDTKDKVAHASYFHKKEKATIELKEIYNITESGVSTSDGYNTIYISTDKKWLVVEVNFGSLMNGTDVEINFEIMSENLLKKLSEIEISNSWAKSISQNIRYKVCDLIPSPNEAALIKWGYKKKNNHFIFLTDDMKSNVDVINKQGNFEYLKIGEFSDEFMRDCIDGMIIQDKLQSSNSNRPSNVLDKNKELYLLSSFSDIQNSETLRKIPYLLLFDPRLKRNNNSAKNLPSPYTLNDDNENYVGNSVYVHLYTSQIKDFDFTAIKLPNEYVKSIYGPRNPIEITIGIKVNGQDRNIQLNSTIGDLKELPKKFKIYRKYGDDRYVLMKLSDWKIAKEIKLMPYDIIIYKP